jgi:nicotinate phosphoribosyltransferase
VPVQKYISKKLNIACDLFKKGFSSLIIYQVLSILHDIASKKNSCSLRKQEIRNRERDTDFSCKLQEVSLLPDNVSTTEVGSTVPNLTVFNVRLFGASHLLDTQGIIVTGVGPLLLFTNMMRLSPPSNALVTPLLTDMYQITMTYAHWKNGRVNDSATFELFFRKNPFGGEFTIFCGLDEVLKFVDNYKFQEEDIEYLMGLPSFRRCDPGFWDYLRQLDCSTVTIHAMKEGTIAFPRVPMLIIQGPLGITQLLETTLLTLVNYPSLVATNAARMVVAAKEENYYKESKVPRCVEFGLRRAQGPDGAFSASKYSAIGGFVATSNVQAGKLANLAVVGTHGHSYVQAYESLEEVTELTIVDTHSEKEICILPLVNRYRKELGDHYLTTNDGELAAFIAYAVAFPENFLCLIDTYDTLSSGLLNFCLVALTLDDLGYAPRGVRLDSGDLAYLSLKCAQVFKKFDRPSFRDLDIVASNDINEEVLHALNKQGHAITLFGIGTNLVTCQAQPSLGCVFKLVEINGVPRIKLSQDLEKVLIPGQKKAFRLYGVNGWPLFDLLLRCDEPEPEVGKRVMCRHPFIERKRANVTASKIEHLHHVVYQNGDRKIQFPTLEETKAYVEQQLNNLRSDHLRPINPTPYKVSVSQDLFTFLHELWQTESPVVEIY